MDLHVVLMGLAALAAAGLVWLTSTTAAGRKARRTILLLAVTQIGVFYLATSDLLGRPKPTTVEAFKGRLTEAEVLAHHLIQDEAIYLWVRPEESDGPIAYRMPWVEQTARELHEASRKAEADGGSVRFTMRGDDGTEGGEPSVGWTPPAAPPPKASR